MRTETDDFYNEDSGDTFSAFVSGLSDEMICFSCAYPLLSKEQTRQIAMQLLEMCGELEAAPQPDFNFVKDDDND